MAEDEEAARSDDLADEAASARYNGDLVPLPLGIDAQLVELTCGVFTGPRGFCACVIGACLCRMAS